MKVIYKQILPFEILNDFKIIELPLKSVILSIQIQFNRITIWYEFDKQFEHNLVDRKIFCIGTGISFDFTVENKYITTLQYCGIVYHFYEGV